jgi:hypothetical protein
VIGDPCCSYVSNVANAMNATYISLQNILTYPDDYGCLGHPNVVGHAKMAETVAPYIKKVMGW